MERISRFLADHRRVLAAAFAGLATWAALTVLTADPASRPMLVAAHDLPSGHLLTEDDIVQVSAPDRLAVATVSDPVGAMAAGPMRAGEPLTDRRVVDPRALPDGQVLASITADRSTAALVRPGDIVDVLAIAQEQAPELLVEAAEVLVVEEREGTDVTTLGLAVQPRIARALAATSTSARFTVTHAAR